MKKKIYYLDVLRALATIAVVGTHVSGMYMYTWSMNTFNAQFICATKSIERFGVSLFVMISGALLLSSSVDIRSIYKKRIPKLIRIYVLWSVFYALKAALFSAVKHHSPEPPGVIIREMITGHYHLWFLPMIIGLYIILPVLKKITEDKKITEYYLLISFISTGVIPFFLLALKAADQLLGTETFYSPAFALWDNVYFNFAVGFSFYYVFGYYLHTYDIGKKKTNLLCVLGILGFISSIVLNIAYSRFKNEPDESFISNTLVTVMFEVVGIFIFVRNNAKEPGTPDFFSKLIKEISRCSLGIYLIHPFVLETICKLFDLYNENISPLITFPITYLITLVFSYAFSYLLHKIPVCAKYLV